MRLTPPPTQQHRCLTIYLLCSVSGITECSGKGSLVLHGNLAIMRYWEEVGSAIEIFDLRLMKSAPLKQGVFNHEHATPKMEKSK